MKAERDTKVVPSVVNSRQTDAGKYMGGLGKFVSTWTESLAVFKRATGLVATGPYL